MDRCRCEEYEYAVKNLKVCVPGGYSYDVIKNYDRSGFKVCWMLNKVGFEDCRPHFPRVIRMPPADQPEDERTREARKIERMWCPYLETKKRITK